jgi:hypothetical protein
MREYCSPGAALRRLFRVISYSIWSDHALTVLAMDNIGRMLKDRLNFVQQLPGSSSYSGVGIRVAKNRIKFINS